MLNNSTFVIIFVINVLKYFKEIASQKAISKYNNLEHKHKSLYKITITK